MDSVLPFYIAFAIYGGILIGVAVLVILLLFFALRGEAKESKKKKEKNPWNVIDPLLNTSLASKNEENKVKKKRSDDIENGIDYPYHKSQLEFYTRESPSSMDKSGNKHKKKTSKSAPTSPMGKKAKRNKSPRKKSREKSPSKQWQKAAGNQTFCFYLSFIYCFYEVREEMNKNV